MQFFILSIASFAVGIIAMMKVAPGTLHRFIPAGWENVFFGWHLNMDWSTLIPSATAKIAEDHYGLFGFFVMMLLFKGMLISAAGPAPNYDMQRVLSCKNPREASMISGWVNVVLTFPRYFLITGLTVLALVFFSDTIRGMGTNMDFERILPEALGRFVPAGLLGFLIAGLLAAYMSNFAATVNAAPPYFVNDIYKRYINPNANPKTYVRLSYLSSFMVVLLGVAIGWYVGSVNGVVIWIVTSLWGGYTASNVLKWYWWRFNGHGYFWGMVVGMASSLTIPLVLTKIEPLQAWASKYSLNLEVSVGFGLVFALSLIGVPTRNPTHETRGRRSFEGLLSSRSAVGFLEPDPQESPSGGSILPPQYGLLSGHVQRVCGNDLAGKPRSFTDLYSDVEPALRDLRFSGRCGHIFDSEVRLV